MLFCEWMMFGWENFIGNHLTKIFARKLFQENAFQITNFDNAFQITNFDNVFQIANFDNAFQIPKLKRLLMYIPMRGCVKGSCWVITKIPSEQKLSPIRCVSCRNMAVVTGNQMQIGIPLVFSLQWKRVLIWYVQKQVIVLFNKYQRSIYVFIVMA